MSIIWIALLGLVGAAFLHRVLLCLRFAAASAAAHNECESFFFKEKMRRCFAFDRSLKSDSRDSSCNTWGWAVPTRKAIETVVASAREGGCERILDFGAGRGYWSRLISQEAQDMEVIAMDSNVAWYRARRHFEIYKGGVEEAKGLLEDVATCLLLVWPPCWSTMAEEALSHFRGPVVVYVGEKEGGKTAAKGFFVALRARWQLQTVLPLPNWTGCSDKVFVFVRRRSRHAL